MVMTTSNLFNDNVQKEAIAKQMEILSKSNFDKVRDFHEKFKCKIGERPNIPLEYVELRKKLIQEEYEELLRGLDNGDLENIIKEMCDLLYVIYGMGVTFGVDLDAAFDAVHRSNMTKSLTEQRADGKVMKGPDYIPADLKPFLTGGNS